MQPPLLFFFFFFFFFSSSTSSLSSSPPPPPFASIDLFSAHDTTVVPILTSLGAYDGNWPDYASYVAFELWSGGWSSSSSLSGTTDEEPRVRVIFNGKPIDVGRHTPPGGGGGGGIWEVEGVPLSDFKRAMALLVPGDYEAECLAKGGERRHRRKRRVGALAAPPRMGRALAAW